MGSRKVKILEPVEIKFIVQGEYFARAFVTSALEEAIQAAKGLMYITDDESEELRNSVQKSGFGFLSVDWNWVSIRRAQFQLDPKPENA